MNYIEPGVIYQLEDGLMVLHHLDQPLRFNNGMVTLHLLDGSLDYILDEELNPKVIVLNEFDFYQEMQAAKIIGFVGGE